MHRFLMSALYCLSSFALRLLYIECTSMLLKYCDIRIINNYADMAKSLTVKLAEMLEHG